MNDIANDHFAGSRGPLGPRLRRAGLLAVTAASHAGLKLRPGYGRTS